MNVAKKVQEAGLILGSLGVIGFIGIIWLMIYGNLSGNLGFGDDSNALAIVNETRASINTTGYNLSVVNSSTGNYVLTAIWGNTPSGVTTYNYSILLANATVSSVGRVTNLTEFNVTILSNVSLSYTVAYATPSAGKVNTENVITNLTGGFGTFFGFSGTFFTIAAIVLLIFMLLGLLALVWSIIQMQGGKGKGFSSS